tara:strand:+ start:1553 stop:2143 length:591 start_codon:yes stop_codon:yes gene_type:complete
MTVNKLLGVDIDTIIKRVLVETLGAEKDVQDKKSEEMKDFKAPPDSGKKKSDEEVDEAEEEGPVQTPEEVDKSVKASDIVDLLGRMRSGQSLKDQKVRKAFQQYFDGLGGAERLAMKAFMSAITDIVAGENSEEDIRDEPTPEDLGIDMEVEDEPKKKVKKKSKKASASKKDDSAPIVVGEAANKSRELQVLRRLK